MKAQQVAVVVPPQLEGERLDKALAELVPQLSRQLARKVLAMGAVLVNRKVCRRASFQVRANDRLQATWHPDVLEPERYELAVVYEDADIVIVNKPTGQLSQGSELGDTGSLIHSLSRRYGPNVRLMHRLDKGTSGLLVAVKTPAASQFLTPQIREHTFERRYWGLVLGVPVEGPVEVPIVIDRRFARAALPHEEGMPARSIVKVLESETHNGQTMSLVEVELFTGRTHQIRIHLQSLGTPLFGDPMYGGPEGERLALHARVLGLEAENGQHHRWEVDPPEDFWAVREAWRHPRETAT